MKGLGKVRGEVLLLVDISYLHRLKVNCVKQTSLETVADIRVFNQTRYSSVLGQVNRIATIMCNPWWSKE